MAAIRFVVLFNKLEQITERGALELRTYRQAEANFASAPLEQLRSYCLARRVGVLADLLAAIGVTDPPSVGGTTFAGSFIRIRRTE